MMLESDLNWQMTGFFLLALALLMFVMKLVALLMPVTSRHDRWSRFWLLPSPNSLARSRPVVDAWRVLFRALLLFAAVWLSYRVFRWFVGIVHLRTLQSYAALPILVVMTEFLVALATVLSLPSGQLHPPIHCRPLLARGIADFWGNRWNLWFSDWFRYALFARLRRRPTVALVLVFAISGVMHEWVINVPLYCLTGRALFGSMTAYFLIQAAGVMLEHRFLKGRDRLRIVIAWLVILAPAPLVMNEGLLRTLHLWSEQVSVARTIIEPSGFGGATEAGILFAGEKKLNNLVSELLEVSSISKSSQSFAFTRSNDGWIFISSTCKGTVRVVLDKSDTVIVHDAEGGSEAMRYVTKGEHTIQVEGKGEVNVEKLAVKAIPELIHCGLGFNPEIKSYGLYDMDFLKADILPNVTTLIVPNSIKLSESVIDDWHRQGKRFVAEVGINSQGQTAEDHFKYWSGFYDRTPFLDGIIINEFIVNRPVSEWAEMTPERRARMGQERRQYVVYGEAIKKMRADDRHKMLYAYVGGSGKKLNQEVIGTNFIRTIADCGYRVALERYLHEMSSEQGSKDALQTFVDGIADWEAREPGVKKQMVIAFGLFSMPPGGINKQPNVDYHVWMDQQMNNLANHPVLSGIGGLEWWTSVLADEETVRFVGKLYRHYAIEGKTEMLTRDPLFLTHIQNADFEKGTEGWTLHPAEEGTIAAKSFPRYGRIEGRYMGLGRPADPEHIGDTFLWMKRSEKGPNTFSQTIKDLEPGRLYSMKMFSCDYNDLVNPKAKKPEETKSIATVVIEGVDIDGKRSFTEVYSSNPEPRIPVCITYYWKVFRAKATPAKLTVSDWRSEQEPDVPFGQEQTFNFLEIQPYRE